jgi:hypothetical protein
VNHADCFLAVVFAVPLALGLRSIVLAVADLAHVLGQWRRDRIRRRILPGSRVVWRRR